MQENENFFLKDMECFTVGFENQTASITGSDYSEFLHGEIYKKIVEISNYVLLWNPVTDIESKYVQKSGLYGVSLYSNSEIGFRDLCSHINLTHNKRGSILFHIDIEKYKDILEVIIQSDYFGVPTSKAQVISNNNKAAYEYSKNIIRKGGLAVLVGRQTGAKYFEVFANKNNIVKLVNGCISAREATFKPGFWPTESF